MAYFTFVKAAFSSAVNSVITEVGANPPAALPLRHDPPGIHTVYPAAMWMRPHSAKQMEAIMAAASLTVGAGMNENEGNENKRGAVNKKIDQRNSLLRQKRMIRVTETKRMMATNKPGVVQMKGGAYVILIILLYVDISISIR